MIQMKMGGMVCAASQAARWTNSFVTGLNHGTMMHGYVRLSSEPARLITFSVPRVSCMLSMMIFDVHQALHLRVSFPRIPQSLLHT